MFSVPCGAQNQIPGRDINFGRLVFETRDTEAIRSDNGPEFIAKKLVAWMKSLEVQPLFIQAGGPWENGYCESFNGKMRYELLDVEIFYSLLEAKIIIER